MYSIVLMMALNTSAEVPTFGGGCRGGCNGCSGYSCSGSSCNGCSGGRGHGCKGGCNGCSGGFLGGLFKGHGCKGSCNGCKGGCNGGYACNGCTGGHGCAGGHGCTGGAVAPAPIKEMPKEKKEGVSAPATIVVNIPADAKLSIDENPTRSTETVRRFVTPALETGKDYYYNVKAELVVDGQTQTATKRVLVRAGEESQVSIEFTVSSVVSK